MRPSDLHKWKNLIELWIQRNPFWLKSMIGKNRKKNESLLKEEECGMSDLRKWNTNNLNSFNQPSLLIHECMKVQFSSRVKMHGLGFPLFQSRHSVRLHSMNSLNEWGFFLFFLMGFRRKNPYQMMFLSICLYDIIWLK